MRYGRMTAAGLLVAVLVLTARPAWSGQVGDQDDKCLPYLVMLADPHSAMTSQQQGRENVAGPMAVSLLLGVRTAVGPRETTIRGVRAIGRNGVDSYQARAVADYRACRNRQALDAMTAAAY